MSTGIKMMKNEVTIPERKQRLDALGFVWDGRT